MDYQYYKFDGDSSYRLKQSGLIVRGIIYTIIIGILFIIIMSVVTEVVLAFCMVSPISLLFGIISIIDRRKVVINPDTKTITIKPALRKEWQYAFSEFLGFREIRHITRDRGWSFTDYRICMFFNDNGKKKAVFLNTHYSGHSREMADAIIAETADLLGIKHLVFKITK